MPYRSMLVGTDGSLTAGRAVARAVALAAASGARLRVAFIGDPVPGRAVLDGAERLYADSGVSIATSLLSGDPADALLGLAEAERVDLIVVGSKGMASGGRFLLGSVPNKVSHRASCDVLVVHTTGS